MVAIMQCISRAACSAFLLCFSVPRSVPRRVISYRKFVSCSEICSYRERRAEQKWPGESCLIFPCLKLQLIVASKTSVCRLSLSFSQFEQEFACFFLNSNKRDERLLENHLPFLAVFRAHIIIRVRLYFGSIDS